MTGSRVVEVLLVVLLVVVMLAGQVRRLRPAVPDRGVQWPAFRR